MRTLAMLASAATLGLTAAALAQQPKGQESNAPTSAPKPRPEAAASASNPSAQPQSQATTRPMGGERGDGRSAAAAASANADRGMSYIAKEAEATKPVSAADVYKGFRARQLIGQTVYGTKDNRLGEVQDLIVGKDGRLAAVVVEGGGFMDIGDATFRIPFKEIDLTPGKDGVVATQLTEDQAERYGLYEQPEAVATGPREFRANELIGDYARLRQGQGYGSVRDVVFGKDGEVMAVLVGRDVRYGAGMYAYPYYGYRWGWHPGSNYYALPFDGEKVTSERGPQVELGKFDKTVL